MSTPKNKPGIHLFSKLVAQVHKRPINKKQWYWHIVSKNGRIIARSSETYSSKRAAVRSIKVAAFIFRYDSPFSYYDHSTPAVKKAMYYNK